MAIISGRQDLPETTAYHSGMTERGGHANRHKGYRQVTIKQDRDWAPAKERLHDLQLGRKFQVAGCYARKTVERTARKNLCNRRGGQDRRKEGEKDSAIRGQEGMARNGRPRTCQRENCTATHIVFLWRGSENSVNWQTMVCLAAGALAIPPSDYTWNKTTEIGW